MYQLVLGPHLCNPLIDDLLLFIEKSEIWNIAE